MLISSIYKFYRLKNTSINKLNDTHRYIFGRIYNLFKNENFLDKQNISFYRKSNFYRNYGYRHAGIYQTENALFISKNGLRYAKDLNEGDEIWSIGKWNKVLAIQEIDMSEFYLLLYSKKIFKLNPFGPVVFSSNTNVHFLKEQHEPKTTRFPLFLSEQRFKRYKIISGPLLEDSYSEKEYSPYHFLFGYILNDYDAYKKIFVIEDRYIQFSCKHNQCYIFDMLFNSDIVQKKILKRKVKYTIHLKDPKYTEMFLPTVHGLDLPEWIWKGNRNEIRSFLAGWLTGGNLIRKNTKDFNIFNHYSENFFFKLYFMLNSVGIDMKNIYNSKNNFIKILNIDMVQEKIGSYNTDLNEYFWGIFDEPEYENEQIYVKKFQLKQSEELFTEKYYMIWLRLPIPVWVNGMVVALDRIPQNIKTRHEMLAIKKTNVIDQESIDKIEPDTIL